MSEKKILIIDDNPTHRELISARLQEDIPGIQIFETGDAPSSFDILSEEMFNLILLDYHLPSMTGLEFLEKSRDIRGKTPLLMVTGEGNEEVAAKAFKLGVTDYIVKSLDLPVRMSRIVRDLFAKPADEKHTPSANLNSAESGIKLVEEFQASILTSSKGRNFKENLIVEFNSSNEFNEFSRWVASHNNTNIEQVEILDHKYVLMVSVMPQGYDRIA